MRSLKGKEWSNGISFFLLTYMYAARNKNRDTCLTYIFTNLAIKVVNNVAHPSNVNKHNAANSDYDDKYSY